MRTRLFFALPILLSTAALAQVPAGQTDGGGPTPDQQDLQQQMQDMRQKVMDNMQKQGVDPATFFQDMMQRMQNGSLDFSQLQQELVDKGFLDQASVDKLQGTMQKVTDATIREQLQVTDEEWAVIQPKIRKVLAAQSALGQGAQRQGGIMGGFLSGAGGQSKVALALAELRHALHTPDTSDDTIKAKLQAVRDARASAQTDFNAAVKDLDVVLTMRQEAILSRIPASSRNRLEFRRHPPRRAPSFDPERPPLGHIPHTPVPRPHTPVPRPHTPPPLTPSSPYSPNAPSTPHPISH